MNQKARIACVNSAKGRDRYRNMRSFARAVEPRAATGGFPYNLRSVAEADPLPSRRVDYAHKHDPKDYGCNA
jgi:hypothetical protein